MNLPNKLTLLRVALVPVFVIVMTVGISAPWVNIIAAAVFGVTSLTDMLDGKIARKYDLVTDFGKFMDPVADKFMVFSALITMLSNDAFSYMRVLLLCLTLVVIFRELAVTSLRMVVSGKASATALAANMLGKIKTVSQITFILTALLEPVIFGYIPIVDVVAEYHILTYATMAFMAVMTVWSGLNYARAYGKFLDLK